MLKFKKFSEEVELNESHFKVGDKVKCIHSGKEGVVTKVDPSEKGKYYTVKRDDGEVMQYAPDDLEALKESVELDELDSKTYRSYHDKATADQLKRMDKEKKTDKDRHTMRKRSLGIATAGMKQYGDKRTMKQRIRGEEVELDEAVKTKVYKSGKYWLVDVTSSKIDYTDWGPTGRGFASEKDAQEFAKHMQKSVKESVELGEARAARPPKLKGNNGPYTRQQIEKAAKEAKVDIGAKSRMLMALRNMKEGLEEEFLNEGRNEALKALEGLVKKGGIDKPTFQKAHDLYKATKYIELKKLIKNADTDVSEAIADVIMRHDSKAFNSMYPRAKSGDYLRKIIADHG